LLAGVMATVIALSSLTSTAWSAAGDTAPSAATATATATKPTKPTKSTEPTKPTKPIEPTKPTKPTEPTKPTKPPARHHKPAGPTKASVSVDPAAVIGPAVADDFLGLSFETSSLPDVAAYARSGDLVNLMSSLGQGVMRFGGISADTETMWLPEGSAPAWVTTPIVPQDLAGVASLARETGWRVLLTVNFGHYEAAAAAAEAQSAQAQLGASLLGISIGNEPDRYVADGLRAALWSFPEYVREINAYRGAIATAAPGVPIVGPDSSSSGLDLTWVSETAAAEYPALLTDHYYPLTKCQAFAPKLSDLLSPLTRASESAVLTQLATIGRTYGAPLRVDETNNVSCRGEPGVSDVFASALWAVDYLSRAMASGVAGINFHDLIGEPETYSPLVADSAQELASGALHANPEWYALLLAHRLLDDAPVKAGVTGSANTLTAGAFASARGNLHIVLVDFAPSDAHALLVRLHVGPRYRAGPILRLTAPGLTARSGVTLGGSAVTAAGTWSPVAALPYVSGKPGSLQLEMPASSAALVTLYPAR
jgi:hypothetical protein